MDHDHTSSRDADLAAGHSRGGVSGSNEAPAAQPGCDGDLALRIRPLSIDPSLTAVQKDLLILDGEGFVYCGECHGRPNQYHNDFEECCPTCSGLGLIEDEDADEADAFDPRVEWGTYRTLNGRVLG